MKEQQENTRAFYDSMSPEVLLDNSIPMTKSEEAGELVTGNTVLCKLSQRGTDFTKKVDSVSVIDAEQDIDPRMLSTTKSLIDKKYLDSIHRCDRGIKRVIENLSVRASFVGDGTYLIPLRAFTMVRESLAKYIEERMVLIEDLIGSYDEAIADAESRLGEQFNDDDYLPVVALRGRFRVKYSFWELNVPEQLRRVNEAMYNEAREQMQADMSEAVNEIRLGLRTGMSELVNGLYDKVSKMSSERKVFKEGFVDKVRGFLEVADAKNFINDTELQSLVEQARGLLNGVSPDDLREDYDLQRSVTNGLLDIKENLDEMIEDEYRVMEF